MQEHHIQRNILHKLVLQDKARFADIKPSGVDSNVFTYHLKQLMKEKLVIKLDDGTYSLTPLGRVAGINVTLSKKELLEQAHSILLMSLRTEKEGWLLRKRLAQPMYEKVGFVHAEPVAHEPALKTASETFTLRTGLTADFKVAGTGYVRLFHGDDLESFTHFTLLTADSYSGVLAPIMRNGENYWGKDPDFADTAMIPSMPDLVKMITSSTEIFYADLTYQV
jgi:hypothetical protein